MEIAFFDRGPIDSKDLILGGYWSAYWYNGHIYGSEIARGIDIFALTPSEFLSKNEIDAAILASVSELERSTATSCQLASELSGRARLRRSAHPQPGHFARSSRRHPNDAGAGGSPAQRASARRRCHPGATRDVGDSSRWRCSCIKWSRCLSSARVG